MTSAIDAIPIISSAPQTGGLSDLSSTKGGSGGTSSFNALYSALQSRATQPTQPLPAPSHATPGTQNANPQNSLAGTAGASVRAKSASSTLPLNAADTSPSPALVPSPLPPIVPVLPVADITTPAQLIPSQGQNPSPLPQNQNGNQAEGQTPELSATSLAHVPPPSASLLPNMGPESPQPQDFQPEIQVKAFTATTANANLNPGPSLGTTQNLLGIAANQASISQTPDFPSSPVQFDSPQNPISQPNIQTLAVQTSTIQTAPSPQAVTTPTPGNHTPSAPLSALAADSQSSTTYSLAAAAVYATQSVQVPGSNLKPTPATEFMSPVSAAVADSPPVIADVAATVEPSTPVQANAKPLNAEPADSALAAAASSALFPGDTTNSQDATLTVVASASLPSSQSPGQGESATVSSAATLDPPAPPLPPAAASISDQSVNVPSSPVASLVAAAVSAPTSLPNCIVSPIKNNSLAGPPQNLRSPNSQVTSDDSANLQNEFSIASALVFPAPSSNLPNVHTLVNSATPITQAAAHALTGSTATPVAPLNSTITNAAATATTPASISTPGKTATAIASANNSGAPRPQSSVTSALQPAGALLSSPSPAPGPVVAAGSALPTPTADPAAASAAPAKLPATAAQPSGVPNAPPELPPAAAAAPPGPVQMAQMVSRASQSEMRIGINTSAFGSVEVRTVVHASDVGLSVGSEKGDLHSLLSNELPTIANSLQQQSLRLGQVSFHQGSGLSGNSFSGGGSQQQRFTFSPAASRGLRSDESPEAATESGDSDSLSLGAGLSILA